MIKGKMAELLALGLIAGAVENHSKEKTPIHDADGKLNGIGALAGLGAILGEGLKGMPDDKPKGDKPDLAKEFHKMGMGVDLMGFALDIGLAKDYTAEDFQQLDVKLGELLGKYETLRTKLQGLGEQVEPKAE